MTTQLAQDTETLIDQIPPEVLDELDPGTIQDLGEGIIEKIPQEVIDRLPESLQDKIPEGLLESVGANPVLAGILIAVGGIAVAGFLYGVAKSAWKAAFFAGIVGAASWFWYFNIR